MTAPNRLLQTHDGPEYVKSLKDTGIPAHQAEAIATGVENVSNDTNNYYAAMLQIWQGHQGQLDEIKTTLDGHQGQLDEIKTTLVSHQGQLDEIKTTLVGHQGQLDEIKTTLVSHQGQLDEIKTTLVSHQGQLDEIKTTLVSHQGQLDEIKTRLGVIEAVLQAQYPDAYRQATGGSGE